MSSNVPDYVNTFIDFNKQTLKDIYEAGCLSEKEGILMIEIAIDNNESQVYFVGEKRWNEMGKEEFYKDIRTKIPDNKKDNMILYIMDRNDDKVYLLIIDTNPKEIGNIVSDGDTEPEPE